MLEVSRLSKRFGGLVATNDVSFTIQEGSISALIGPNGAGKTTIFAQISGFHRPDAGDIRFNGRSLVGLTPEKICLLGIARTFQIVQPFAGLNVRENIAVGAHLRRAGRRAALEHAEAIAHRVGLGPQLDKPAAALTVAGRKRLELAKALATDPKLLLLDEVMAGLNPAEIDEIIPIIRGIRQSGVTILLIEHVMRAVMNLSDHAWVLNNGALIASGTPSQIAANPQVIEAYLGHGAAARMQAQIQEARHA
ncbi:ABC transporter ATP-binding protein [uncultured Ferrovibrio sp.]|jgi:branched-chain amino acid transport system ATP-binding protein|uniref:ABC transporter ATP-binding protein n=1 Tax=uncultured Ferrovibrio sp. TaxID=1576913 RepID=UPI00261829E7|nr:ABC transporter ATP-binding protein [uncultured Ferrovibrio sp.]